MAGLAMPARHDGGSGIMTVFKAVVSYRSSFCAWDHRRARTRRSSRPATQRWTASLDSIVTGGTSARRRAAVGASRES
jgi:alkylhydroperoxidase family enzyme